MKTEVIANNAQSKAMVKVMPKHKGKTEQNVKVRTKQWEDTVVSKHETWKTYTNIRKNLKISTQNVKLVSSNLKKAESKIIQIQKAAALDTKDKMLQAKLEEAKRIADTIRRQREDANSQRIKMESEKKMAQAKAREVSIAAAKAKAAAERAYRKMVFDNNKVCGQCAVGAKRIKQRRVEINKQNKSTQHAKQVETVANEKRANKEAHKKKNETVKKIQKKSGGKKTKSPVKKSIKQRKAAGKPKNIKKVLKTKKCRSKSCQSAGKKTKTIVKQIKKKTEGAKSIDVKQFTGYLTFLKSVKNTKSYTALVRDLKSGNKMRLALW